MRIEIIDSCIFKAGFENRLGIYYHFNSSPKATKGSFPKILVNDLKLFPLPNKPDESICDEITKHIIDHHDKHVDYDVLEIEVLDQKIDNLVFNLYGLDETESSLINEMFD